MLVEDVISDQLKVSIQRAFARLHTGPSALSVAEDSRARRVIGSSEKLLKTQLFNFLGNMGYMSVID